MIDSLSKQNTYISVTDADTYFANRNEETTWDSHTTAEKRLAIRMALQLYNNVFLPEEIPNYTRILKHKTTSKGKDMITIYDKCNLNELIELLSSFAYDRGYEGPKTNTNSQVVFVTPDDRYSRFTIWNEKVEGITKPNVTIIELYDD